MIKIADQEELYELFDSYPEFEQLIIDMASYIVEQYSDAEPYLIYYYDPEFGPDHPIFYVYSPTLISECGSAAIRCDERLQSLFRDRINKLPFEFSVLLAYEPFEGALKGLNTMADSWQLHRFLEDNYEVSDDA